jgi:hypothetical protein
MMGSCVEPEVGARILERGAGGRAPSREETEKHLRACEACRVVAERADRVRQAWRAVEPTTGEIRAARARMARTKGARGRRRLVPAVVAVAIVLVAAAAFAGVRTGVLRRLISGTHAVAPEVPATTMGTATAHGAPAPPVAAPSLVTQAPPELDAVDPESLPLVIDPTPSARMHPAVAPSSDAPSPATSASTTATAGGWAAAAEALRAGDYASADRAFGDLAASGDPRTRDEARLARAEVWIAQGRTGDARHALEQLASSGATSLVRTRATDMLRSMRSGSSVRDAPGTNTP